MFSRLIFSYTYFLILRKLGRIVTRIYTYTFECFVPYLTFYLAVHISSCVKLNNSMIFS